MSNLSGQVLEREKRHFRARRGSITVSQVGDGEENRSSTNQWISDPGVLRQVKDEEKARSKIAGKALLHISWTDTLSEPPSDLLM